MATPTLYSYEPVKPHQLRLLKFVDYGTSVSVVLKTFSLHQPLPAYDSLSYTWTTNGDVLSKSWNLVINKQQLPVLDTLRPFIDVLESKGQLLDGRWWWIDSICINQSDVEEKAQQIQHMQRIYSQASRVICWLGKESGDSNIAMEFVKHLDKMSREKYHIDKLRTILQASEYRAKWAALGNLLSRRWWSRIWTVQEFVLPASISFWCGTRSVSRVAMCRSISTADKCPSVGIKATHGFIKANNRRRARGLHKYTTSAGVNVTLTLAALADYFSCMDVTDGRDRLYGLMGLSTDKWLPDVNYLINAEEVCLRFAQAFITHYKSLDIIAFALTQIRPCSSWPSWVPSWRNDKALVVPLMVSQSSRTQIGNLRTPAALEVDASVVYSASGASEAIFKFEGSTLVVHGVVLDTVDGLAGSCHSKMDQCSAWESENVLSCSSSPTNILTSLCRCLVLDRKDRYMRCPMPTVEFLRDFLQLLAPLITETDIEPSPEIKEWFSWTKSLLIQGRSFESILRQILHAGIDHQGPAPNRDEYYHYTFFGRFFDTVIRMSLRLVVSRRGYLGMASGKAGKGDLVCLLYGCSVPVLLREDEAQGGFIFIGNEALLGMDIKY
ncbi:unnamed protein product [Fusarium graminearum]|nr:unnamed protein product [Fusarium graminearum]CAG1988031.1 unnamed protein product [Fusarium graminearum]